MKTFDPSAQLAEMLAFEASMRAAYDYTPRRNPDGDWESAYVNPRDRATASLAGRCAARSASGPLANRPTARIC